MATEGDWHVEIKMLISLFYLTLALKNKNAIKTKQKHWKNYTIDDVICVIGLYQNGLRD